MARIMSERALLSPFDHAVIASALAAMVAAQRLPQSVLV